MKYIGAGSNSQSLGYTMTLWIQLAKFACFETDHFVLRPFSYEDGEDFYTIVSHAENLPFIFPVLKDKEIAVATMVEKFIRSPLGNWALTEKTLVE